MHPSPTRPRRRRKPSSTSSHLPPSSSSCPHSLITTIPFKPNPPSTTIIKTQAAFVPKLFSSVSLSFQSAFNLVLLLILFFFLRFLSHFDRMLEEPVIPIGSEALISWSTMGDVFCVYDPIEFSRLILPQHFKHNNWQSFVRQLNMYGFHKVFIFYFSIIQSFNEHILIFFWKTTVCQSTTPYQVNDLLSGHHEMGTGTHTIQAWEFRHPHFRRNRPDLLPMIKRKSNKHPPPPTSLSTQPNQPTHIPPLHLPPPPPSLGPLHGHPPPPPPLFIRPTRRHPSSSSSVSTPPLHALNGFMDPNPMPVSHHQSEESLSPDLLTSSFALRPYDPVRDPHGVTLASKTTSPDSTPHHHHHHHSLSERMRISIHDQDRQEISEILRMMLGWMTTLKASAAASDPALHHHHCRFFFFCITILLIYIYHLKGDLKERKLIYTQQYKPCLLFFLKKNSS